MKQAEKTRQSLLDAAMKLTQTRGAAPLTLDAVAKMAEVSKGGLLHHFPSKDALIEGLLMKLLDEFEARVTAYAEKEAPSAGRWLRAYVRSTFDPSPPTPESWILLLPLIEHERFWTLIRQDTERWRERLLNDGIARGRALVIWQAADAMLINQMFELQVADAESHADALEELLRLAVAE